ncbi:MAG: MmcQ/YjbR family DNA-binding protein [Phenylobacterium sp.]
MATFDDLRRLALALPGAWEETYKGEPWFQVGRKSFALRSNGRVIMKLDRAHQELLFEVRPETFQKCKVATVYWSFVVLENVEVEELAKLVFEAWSSIVPKKVSRGLTAAT